MSRRTPAARWVCLLLVLCVQANATTDVVGSLKSKGFNKFAALLEAAGMEKALDNPYAVFTIMAPNDLAVDNFLATMGLTFDELKARPLLAKHIIVQHLITKHNVREQELFDKGNTRIVSTVAGSPNDLLFRRLSDGSIKVTDFQGNVANMKKNYITIDDNKTAHPIDKVLWSDAYYPDFAALCKVRKTTLSDFCNAVLYAGLNSTLNSKGFANTVFVPSNTGFAAAKLNLGSGSVPPPATAATMLKYHVLPGIKELPKGFNQGAAVSTLDNGASLKVERVKLQPPANSSRKRPFVTGYVIPASGEKVLVVKPNVFVGKSIVHGIESVLMPPSAAATTKPAPKPSGRRLLHPDLTAAAAATAAIEAALSSDLLSDAGSDLLTFQDAGAAAGRQLLFGWFGDGGPTAEMDAAENEIDLAADGDIPVSQATDYDLVDAEEASRPGLWNYLENGVGPW